MKLLLVFFILIAMVVPFKAAGQEVFEKDVMKTSSGQRTPGASWIWSRMYRT